MRAPVTISVTEFVRHLHDFVPRDSVLKYVNSSNQTELIVKDIVLPYGPITYIRRKKGQHWRSCKIETISEAIVRRVAAQIEPEKAFSIDAILNGTGNNRSVFEAIIAHTPQFYICHPGKHLNGVTDQRKHLYWNPNKPHQAGVIAETNEILGIITSPRQNFTLTTHGHPAPNFNRLRPHHQKQVQAFEIGAALTWSVWIAENDHDIRLGRTRLAQHPQAIRHLTQVPIIKSSPEAIKAARHLDVMFVRNDGYIPAIIEIEHSTGISSGLTRMNNFRHSMSGVYANQGQGGTSFIICAEDEKAEEVKAKATRQFDTMAPRFLPYSRLELLWQLCRDNRQGALKDNLFEIFSEPCR
mgnify:CR=1 FL=1|jgi:hypothetical protein